MIDTSSSLFFFPLPYKIISHIIYMYSVVIHSCSTVSFLYFYILYNHMRNSYYTLTLIHTSLLLLYYQQMYHPQFLYCNVIHFTFLLTIQITLHYFIKYGISVMYTNILFYFCKFILYEDDIY